MKELLILSLAIFLGFSAFPTKPVLAESGSSTVQKALENTKQFLDDLVAAKDESTGDELDLRIKTFRQVLDLSETEAKNFAFRILAVEKDEKLESWKKYAFAKLDESMSFLSSQKTLVSDEKLLDLAGMKQIARDFKFWRETKYLPLASQVQDFLLIKQEAKSVQVAQNRLSKITADLKKLNRTKVSGSAEIKKLMEGSRLNVLSAADLNNRAYGMFLSKYENIAATSSTELPVISDIPSSISPSADEEENPVLKANVSATSTDAVASSTAVSNPPIVSIKDLVRASLNKIKDAYRGFIDISNLVRKLLD